MIIRRFPWIFEIWDWCATLWSWCATFIDLIRIRHCRIRTIWPICEMLLLYLSLQVGSERWMKLLSSKCNHFETLQCNMRDLERFAEGCLRDIYICKEREIRGLFLIILQYKLKKFEISKGRGPDTSLPRSYTCICVI